MNESGSQRESELWLELAGQLALLPTVAVIESAARDSTLARKRNGLKRPPRRAFHSVETTW